ncbi:MULTISPECIES: RNA polymerase sigma factor [Roseateles]|uniref:Sigma-70 family RNA polymerase sigma factor n=1 Tax=Roseateles albus TaxID=2987525 RepID=A0ABT5KN31_9BURK|nr:MULTISPECIES: sigma-70 family RNA polymerase sigma factor [Roseateles]MCV2360092.1 sigma-70 family RNA polymerase sigma factor [Paucibacter sp. TC2R-5]MDC8774256.1 sigma-70 family RNA polymerase sigma factor [Roseateles albus]
MIAAKAQLIEAAARGEAGAVSSLLSVCQPDLKRFARRTCSTTEDAEDAVQIALWQLYRKIGALRTAATFATWMFRIVERECYRLFRLRSKAEDLDELAPQDMPAAAAVPTDLRLDLVRAMERLTPPYREVLLLRDVHELTAPEVAAQLGLSLEAVKSRLHRARAQVREHLMASGYWMKDGALEPRSFEVNKDA